ncbi:uncharacterized protein B0H18DRAFT_892711 [Fomitopsis serialis]|uniref:uncharacterized protein n=1 Tax=Fomitopsis serialis TaxID=139415 RepID=UPI002007D679|nr:uncharacterized protein B0H18DRAFT_892711 [Neoantrodia serialis]KAH9911500.1 hypothetical protein B0H18DRAFT_892711 [Neoantrodia serialis]
MLATIDTVPRLQAQISTTAKAILPSIPKITGKRFQKLVVTKRPQAAPAKVTRTLPSRTTNDIQERRGPPALYHLDFPPPAPVPELTSITLPPSLAQRKRVQHWAVILSGLAAAERRQCVLVSRMFRYAVYLSAFHILNQRHDGRRLSQDISQYSQAMTNTWPYLRIREAEALQRRRIHEASFLAKFIRSRGLPDPVASHLWSSPDDDKQISVALKFVLSRLWFALSIGCGADDSKSISWLQAVVVDAQPVIPNEIWSITVEHGIGSSQQRETFYVLEATYEPVGRPAVAHSPGQRDPATQPDMPVRADWSKYVDRHLRSSKESTTLRLLDQLKWANHEEYERGISRLWLKRIQGEGELGRAKRIVAERYVLACVVANSVSGQWMSASEMAQDFDGLSSRSHAASVRPKAGQVNMYLPELIAPCFPRHHHIESIHFTSTGGKPLHPALAVVQTPHRAYFILRDNGMQVGCEEEGVASVWQEVVGCNQLGH